MAKPKNIARDGAPKNFKIAEREHGAHPDELLGYPVGTHRCAHPDAEMSCPTHDGMYHMSNGQLIAGMSRTKAAHPSILPGTPIITTPTVAKRLERLS